MGEGVVEGTVAGARWRIERLGCVPRGSRLAAAVDRAAIEDFFRKIAKKGISFLTMSKCGLISNFGVNFSEMSASSELEPHPRSPRERRSQLTAESARAVGSAGSGGWMVRGRLLGVRAEGGTRGEFTAG